MKSILIAVFFVISNMASADWCQDLNTIYTKAASYYDKEIPIDRVFDSVFKNYNGGDEALQIILNTITTAYQNRHDGYSLEMGQELLLSDCRYSFSEGR